MAQKLHYDERKRINNRISEEQRRLKEELQQIK